jgi:hypothetical protein
MGDCLSQHRGHTRSDPARGRISTQVHHENGSAVRPAFPVEKALSTSLDIIRITIPLFFGNFLLKLILLT